MGNLDVKYLFESQCELIDNIKELLKVLDGKKYGKELERLYEEFIDEIREHVYSKKESKKILVTLYFSLKIIKENIDKNFAYNIIEDNKMIRLLLLNKTISEEMFEQYKFEKGGISRYDPESFVYAVIRPIFAVDIIIG